MPSSDIQLMRKTQKTQDSETQKWNFVSLLRLFGSSSQQIPSWNTTLALGFIWRHKIADKFKCSHHFSNIYRELISKSVNLYHEAISDEKGNHYIVYLKHSTSDCIVRYQHHLQFRLDFIKKSHDCKAFMIIDI